MTTTTADRPRRTAVRAAWLFEGVSGALTPEPTVLLDGTRATTSVAAQVRGLGDRKGRVAEGYDADLLAVGGDPLANPEVLHDIRAVFVRGARLR